jgi:hypothetical protein
MYGRKAEHESALADLDKQHQETLGYICDITEQLNRASEELRSLIKRQLERRYELRHLGGNIRQTAKQLRTVRRRIKDSVGQDVCPQCGSTEIATILYGYRVEEPEDDQVEPDYVMGGCSINLDETVCCLDCGEKFLDNFEKWKRARIPETVLEVGAEGGSLSILRQWNEHGTWEYRCLRDEMTISELLPEGESVNRDDLFEKSDHEDKFEDALLRLDQYPWFRLIPLKVHEDFADLMLREVEKRGGKEAAVEWIERLKRHPFDS